MSSSACRHGTRDIVPGAEWAESIIDAINEARCMVLVVFRPRQQLAKSSGR
jgi:hypothetical protein